ncbi:Asp/Glu/hydantoin racemase protein (plasmid) [Rhizobium gallicum]|uniref:Asp/Glu/hydantoin racemase protein n=1 Tax=Rhizobium gallicum TaxID=56730 RepID=A0A1L5NPI8_9HYPH|nr:hypothetical protein [Rhizobium gallicum]APO69825.1 Asp/Glu/hydantoin racemase protein [Rhizobium gallicum]
MTHLTQGPIGILCLEEPWSPSPPRTWGEDPHLLTTGLVRETVKGVTVPDILSGREHVQEAYINAGKALKAQGCTAISSNCGYSVLYQQAVSRATGLPTLMSSLLLLPLLATIFPADEAIGIICFDTNCPTDEHLTASWPELDKSRIEVVGLEGTEAWRQINRADPEYDWVVIEDAIASCTLKLKQNKRSISAVVLECCAFGPFLPMVQERMNVPTFDIVTAVGSFFGNELLKKGTE